MEAPLLASGIIYRDVPTGIRALNSNTTSSHYMRHMWIASDGVIAFVVQQGGADGHFLVLYESRDSGLTWQPALDIAADASLVSDGIMDSEDNILLVTSSFSAEAPSDVRFFAIQRDSASGAWSLGANSLILAPGPSSFGSRATIARSPQGTLGCAMRLADIDTGKWYIRLSFSQDGGATWEPSPETLGTVNNQAQKNPRLLWLGDDPAVVYQDALRIGTELRRYKRFAVKTPASPTWQISDVALMESNEKDPLGTHWSAAVDSGNNIHLSYQDGPGGNGIKYAQYGYALRKWKAPVTIAAGGTYSNVSASEDGAVAVARDHEEATGKRLVGRAYYPALRQSTKWFSISAQPIPGKMRLCTPERFDGILPVMHSAGDEGDEHLVYNLLSIDGP